MYSLLSNLHRVPEGVRLATTQIKSIPARQKRHTMAGSRGRFGRSLDHTGSFQEELAKVAAKNEPIDQASQKTEG